MKQERWTGAWNLLGAWLSAAPGPLTMWQGAYHRLPRAFAAGALRQSQGVSQACSGPAPSLSSPICRGEALVRQGRSAAAEKGQAPTKEEMGEARERQENPEDLLLVTGQQHAEP